MKNFLMAVGLLFFSGMALAGDSSSGCGLGWQVFKKNSLVSSSFRSTTNAFFSNTIAMTSGTSGCARHSIVMNDMKGIHYTEANFQKLEVQLAQGGGEYVDGLAQVMGCGIQSSYFGNAVKKNYGDVFEENSDHPVDVYSNLKDMISRDALLSQSCGII